MAVPLVRAFALPIVQIAKRITTRGVRSLLWLVPLGFSSADLLLSVIRRRPVRPTFALRQFTIARWADRCLPERAGV